MRGARESGTLCAVSGPRPGRVTAREVLAVREFRALLASSALSVTGDQVSRIAVALLVFARTSSSLAAAATYACSYLSWLVGGPFLSTLADRLPRRRLMVACDLLRAALVAALVLPGVPLALLFVVLVVVGLLSPPFDAAKSAVLPEVLDGDRYVVGSALQNAVFQGAQVAGFLVGGVLVALTSARGALAVDAASFVLSAVVLAVGVRERPLPERPAQTLMADTRAGIGLVTGDAVLRRMLAYGLLAALVAITPEGLAVPVADQLGGGAVLAGVLTAAVPAGFVLGSVGLLRVEVARRPALLPRLALLGGAALALSAVVPVGAVVVVLWLLAGAGSALGLVANAAFMQAVPTELRGRAFGVASTVLMAEQGLLLLLLGGLGEVVTPLLAVAIGGATAVLLLLPLARGARRAGAPAAVPQALTDTSR